MVNFFSHNNSPSYGFMLLEITAWYFFSRQEKNHHAERQCNKPNRVAEPSLLNRVEMGIRSFVAVCAHILGHLLPGFLLYRLSPLHPGAAGLSLLVFLVAGQAAAHEETHDVVNPGPAHRDDQKGKKENQGMGFCHSHACQGVADPLRIERPFHRPEQPWI